MAAVSRMLQMSGRGGNGMLSCSRWMSSHSAKAVTPRAQNVSAWYNDVLREAQLVDSSPVRGCYVMMPRGMAIWDRLRKDVDQRIAETGAVNVYFPLLVPLGFMSKEAEHVEGFAKECAVVTHSRLHLSEDGAMEPDPSSQLQEPYVVRPTSETVVWDSFRKWIRTAADLPVLVNQWANVLRWERRTRPFLRTSEFLWQEGHTAHASREEAWQRAVHMLSVYADSVGETLALPVIPGVKSPSERFAGAEETLTIEAMMQDGWALQCGTSHFLGTSFGEAFGVRFADASGETQPVWATSWGVSTRLLGATIMAHSDDIGFVCPPAVAPIQVEVLPIGQSEEVLAAAESLAALLRKQGIRAEIDLNIRRVAGAGGEHTAGGEGSKSRESLGKRRFASERRGCPLRIELGAAELKNGSATMKPRIMLSSAATSTSIEFACNTDWLQPVAAPWIKGAAESVDPKMQTSLFRDMYATVSMAMTASDPASIRSQSPDQRELARTAMHALCGSLDSGDRLSVVLPTGEDADGCETVATVRATLQSLHATLLGQAMLKLDQRTTILHTKEELLNVAKTLSRDEEAANSAKEGPSNSAKEGPSDTAFVLAPWHDDAEAEADVKRETKLTIRCFPSKMQSDLLSLPCIWTGRPATHAALFARAY